MAAANRIGARAEQLAATLPALLVAAERVAATVVQGVHGRRRVGSGETFWQYRRYQGGDSATAIDWRQSAKSQKTFVRENEWEAAQSVWLWRDGSASMDYQSVGVGAGTASERKQDRADLLLLALASLLLRGGEHVGLYGQDSIATGGRATLNRLGAHLLDHRTGEVDLPAPGRLPRLAQLVLFSDFLAPLEEIDSVVRRFANQGARGHLLQILDGAEEDLPFQGRTEFEGLEGEGKILIGRVESLRDDYRLRMAVRREGLNDIARRAGWGFAVHRTDRSPQTALLALYSALSGGLDGQADQVSQVEL
ncbi:MAG: DUF58 domain-containing protein [Alphaproteobacteria bacterium]|nr:DUF58 domain-containing protein [Alphaproteobacteria bacterium]MDP6256535.1 DUF58 domain-containing protein [Alphaproteobacteria bacterium]MDP7055516.1 DUF58 domain-containing protein [Alphaproteobacteria bacterium]MDP7229380.1 DUF58 domain-containing protein [Alphaproteobacteria bacterium]MDP7462607.1 DUF58 domain-containing protein [Alphaproteobacteria bacterium]